MPWKQWAFMEKVASDQFQSYLQNQVTPQFTSTAQRDTQWAAPPKGAMCVTTDTNTLWLYDGATWQKSGQAAPQIWYAYQAAGFAISVGGSTQNMLNIPALPPGDYLLTCSTSFTYPANSVCQCGFQWYRNAAANRLGDKMYGRGSRDSTLVCRLPITFQALSKADAGGNVTFGVVVDTDAGAPNAGPMSATIQRVTAMN